MARFPRRSDRRRTIVAKLEPGGFQGQILSGIIAYARQAPHWDLISSIGSAGMPEVLRRHAGADGLITHTSQEYYQQLVTDWAKPVVLVEQDPLGQLPLIRCDDWAVGRLAHEYLAGRGFRNFAYLGPPVESYSIRRGAGLIDAAVAAGHRAYRTADMPYLFGVKMDMGFHETERFLSALPEPCGVLLDNSYHAQAAGLVCRHLGLAVPEELALLGVDDDAVTCEGCVPPLSAINQGTFQIGYRAAEMLEAWLAGRPVPTGEQRVMPAGVTERQSTSTHALHDPQVATALEFIREYACDGITAAAVAAETDVSRRQLELLFRRHLGRTIHQEMMRIRLDRVKLLLRTTNRPLAEIADATGFSYPTKMSHAFKRELGLTPSSYRRRAGQM